jgi:hypothetical protein
MDKTYALGSYSYNLISISELLKGGAVIHFEPNNSYLQPSPNSEKIPFTRRNGLFD